MIDLKRLERIIFGGNPQVRRQVALETTVDIARENLAWLEEELRKVKVQLHVEEEYGGKGAARPPTFRIPQLWSQADKVGNTDD